MALDRPSDHLGARATRGAAWIAGATSVTLALSILAQIALGFLLSSQDFGVYAIAISLATALEVVREGGVGRFLARLSPGDFDGIWRSTWRFTLLTSLVAGSALCLLSGPVALVYSEPALRSVVIAIGVSMPLNAFRIVAVPKLQIAFRFKVIGAVQVGVALLRYSMVVALAVAGFGPLSFVLPLIAVGLAETAALAVLTKINPLQLGATAISYFRVLRQTGWSLLGSALHKFQPRVLFVGLGLFAASETVGVIFFGYQLTLQVLTVFSMALQQAGLPAAAQAGVDAVRRRVVASARSLSLLASPVFAAIILLAPGIFWLLWGDRWTDAVVPAQAFAAAFPLYLFVLLLEVVTQARGLFRLWSRVLMPVVISMLSLAAVVGNAVGDDPSVVAMILAGVVVVASVLEAGVLTIRLGVPIRRFAVATLVPYGTWCAPAVAVSFIAVLLAVEQSLLALSGIAVGLLGYSAVVLRFMYWKDLKSALSMIGASR